MDRGHEIGESQACGRSRTGSLPRDHIVITRLRPKQACMLSVNAQLALEACRDLALEHWLNFSVSLLIFLSVFAYWANSSIIDILARSAFTSFRFFLSSSSYSVMLQVRLTSNLEMGATRVEERDKRDPHKRRNILNSLVEVNQAIKA